MIVEVRIVSAEQKHVPLALMPINTILLLLKGGIPVDMHQMPPYGTIEVTFEGRTDEDMVCVFRWDTEAKGEPSVRTVTKP